MSRGTCRVTFEPDGRTAFVPKGTNLVEAAGQAGIVLNQPCGGQGNCGKCRVEVLRNAPAPSAADVRHLSEAELADGWRLACQLHVERDLVVSIPQETRFLEQVILTGGEGKGHPFRPNVRKRFVAVPPATVEDQRSDMDRLRAALGENDLHAGPSLVRALPAVLRQEPDGVTAVLAGDTIRSVEPGDTTDALWGVAFDIGTTTLVCALVDLTAESRAATHRVTARTNPQVHFGDDVVSRISYIEKHPDGLERLRRRLMSSLNEMVGELCAGAGIEPCQVYEATAVGNTTMSHILLGVDPAPIAHSPYVAVVREPVDVPACELGLRINENADVHVLPNIAGFVGSDTVAVVLASGIAREAEIRLGIDIGTNGEVVLGNRERLLACSCAAGPAFEGARILHGMRATQGAISKVSVNDSIQVGVIGGGRPTGICGSGLIDAVAGLLDAGLIDTTGRMVGLEEAGRLPAGLREALTSFDGQPAVELVRAEQSGTGKPILLTQRDVREVQLAKAAIRAGVEVLAAELGIAAHEVSRILVAGGFGNFIRRSCAKRIGLLPPVPSERIEFIGNAAFAGARTALLCADCRREADRISRGTEYIELANRPDFQTHYMEAMMFPRGA